MRHLCSNSIEISTKFIMMTQNGSLKHIGHPPSWIFRIFYRAMLWPCVDVSVGLSVCLSATNRCSTKTAKRRIKQTTPHDSPGETSNFVHELAT